jgi:hypothetical protein
MKTAEQPRAVSTTKHAEYAQEERRHIGHKEHKKRKAIPDLMEIGRRDGPPCRPGCLDNRHRGRRWHGIPALCAYLNIGYWTLDIEYSVQILSGTGSSRLQTASRGWP